MDNKTGYNIIWILPVYSSEFNADQDFIAYDVPSSYSKHPIVEIALYDEVRLK